MYKNKVDKKVNKIFKINQFVLNGYDILVKIKNERKYEKDDYFRTYRYKFDGHDKKIKNKNTSLPIIKISKITKKYSYLKNRIYK